MINPEITFQPSDDTIAIRRHELEWLLKDHRVLAILLDYIDNDISQADGVVEVVEAHEKRIPVIRDEIEKRLVERAHDDGFRLIVRGTGKGKVYLDKNGHWSRDVAEAYAHGEADAVRIAAKLRAEVL